MVFFTIGIASYDYAKYIKKGLDAVKNQTYKNYEILISDDASTDDSQAVIQQYMRDNPALKIRLIVNEKNEGLVSNKNKLIRECRGDYLLLCDADDWMDSRCLEKMAEIIEKEHPDRVMSEVAHVNENGKIIQTEHLVAGQTMWGWNLHHGCAVRTSLLREHQIQICGEHDDIYYTMEVSKYCTKVSYIREVLYYWLVHTDSESRRRKTDRLAVSGCIWLLNYINESIYWLKNAGGGYKEDAEELRFVRLKIYYYFILFIYQKGSLKNKWFLYRNLHRQMRASDKNYLHSRYLRRGSAPILRPFTMRMIRLCVLLEHLHAMPLALTGWHMLTKAVFFG